MSTEGRFVHLELLSRDLRRAVPFFQALLDLEVIAEDEPQPLLALAPRGEARPVIGLAEISESAPHPSHWVLHARVASPADTATRAVDAGGYVYMSPEDVRELPPGLSEAEVGGPPEVSDTHLIGDPRGAILALVSPASGLEPPPAALGAPAWYELLTSDVGGAAAFYAALGWEIGPVTGGCATIGSGGALLGLIRPLPAGAPMGPLWVPCLRVADLDAALGRVRALGGYFFEDPTPVPSGRSAIIIEPSGATVGLWQPAGHA
jgi:predicted enzyme related to lactoylglutathione lyase